MKRCSHYKGDDSCPMKQIQPIACKGYKDSCPEYTIKEVCPNCGYTIDKGACFYCKMD